MSKEVGEMVRSRDVVQAEGSARTEGARRATGVRADGAAAGAGSLAPGQRWSASRKRDVVLRLLRGESLEALSREAGVEIYRLDAWRERAMAGLELGLKDRHGEPVAEVLDAAKRHIGELSMEIELLRERGRVQWRLIIGNRHHGGLLNTNLRALSSKDPHVGHGDRLVPDLERFLPRLRCGDSPYANVSWIPATRIVDSSALHALGTSEGVHQTSHNRLGAASAFRSVPHQRTDCRSQTLRGDRGLAFRDHSRLGPA